MKITLDYVNEANHSHNEPLKVEKLFQLESNTVKFKNEGKKSAYLLFM